MARRGWPPLFLFRWHSVSVWRRRNNASRLRKKSRFRKNGHEMSTMLCRQGLGVADADDLGAQVVAETPGRTGDRDEMPRRQNDDRPADMAPGHRRSMAPTLTTARATKSLSTRSNGSGFSAVSSWDETRSISVRPRPSDRAALARLRRRWDLRPRSGYALPESRTQRHSHPNRRGRSRLPHG
jgi:hypothetical protein